MISQKLEKASLIFPYFLSSSEPKSYINATNIMVIHSYSIWRNQRCVIYSFAIKNTFSNFMK